MTSQDLATYIAEEANKRTDDETKAQFVINFLNELTEMAERVYTEIRNEG